MADFKDSLPGFKKKRQGVASTIRNYFAQMLKAKTPAPHGSAKMPTPSESNPDLPSMAAFPKASKHEDYEARRNESLIAKQARILAEGLDIKVPVIETDIVDVKELPPELHEKKSSTKDSVSLSQFKINVPTRSKQKFPVKISADGPKIKIKALDKGVNNSPVEGDPDIKDQTKVKSDFEIALRYQMPKDLKDPPKKELSKLAQWIGTQISQIERERSDFMDRLLKYRSQWLDFVSTGMQPVWEGAHDVHVPYIFEKIKGMHSRIYQAILGIDPPFSLKPRSAVSEKQKFQKEQLLSYIVKDFANQGDGWEPTVDKDILNFCADGTSFTKQFWKRDVHKYMGVKVEFDGFKDGIEQFTEVEDPREKILYDGPMLKTVNIEDFYIAGVNMDTAETADLVGDREWFTKSELVKLAQQNYFYKDVIDRILSTQPMDQNQVGSLDSTTMKQQVRELAGVNREATGHKVYEIFTLCLRWDIDNDGIDEDLMVWFERRSNSICRMTYVERACPGGVRPYTIKRFIDRPGSPYGIGLAEMLYGINNEIDYIHNQRLDYGTLQNLPFGFVRSASGAKPHPIRLTPGTLYPLDNPQEDVYFPRLNGGTAYGFQEEAKVTDYGDKVSSLSGFNAGSTASQGPTRTATGAAALVSEVNANLDIHIKRFQRGYKRNLMILDKQIQELLPLGTIIRMLGFDGKEILMQFENREAVRYESDFELTANSTSSNKAIERDTANTLLQIFQNPLALQGGLVTPQNLYNVYRNFLQKAEIKDIDAYLTRPQDMMESPYSAKDELTMILGGITPPIYMTDRHQEKLAFFNQFEQSDDFSWYTADHLEIYRKTKKSHEDMLSAMQSQLPLPGNNQLPQASMMNQASIGAGSGAPQGVPQQASDLMPQSSPQQIPQGR